MVIWREDRYRLHRGRGRLWGLIWGGAFLPFFGLWGVLAVSDLEKLEFFFFFGLP